MAQISPALDTLRHDAGLFRELDVLDRLQQSLPDGYDVFHSVAWQTAHQGEDRHGEIDLVVLAPSGNMLLVEVKAGDVALIDGKLVKLYGRRGHDVARQTRMQHAAMLNRLAESGLNAHVTGCVVLPDFRVDEAAIVAMPRERIIDASAYAQLGTRVRERLQQGSSRWSITRRGVRQLRCHRQGRRSRPHLPARADLGGLRTTPERNAVADVVARAPAVAR